MSNEKTEDLPSKVEAFAKLEPLAKVAKVAVTELWKIFVKRYIAKGVSEIFISLVITGVSLVLLGDHRQFLWIPFAAVVVLLFDAIQVLINPQYYAIEDIMEKLHNETALSKKNLYDII